MHTPFQPLRVGFFFFFFLKWQPPEVGWVKINVDAAALLDRSDMAVGAVAHVADGLWARAGIKKDHW